MSCQPLLRVLSTSPGPTVCRLTRGGSCVTDGAGDYGHKERCVIAVLVPGVLGSVGVFDVELGHPKNPKNNKQTPQERLPELRGPLGDVGRRRRADELPGRDARHDHVGRVPPGAAACRRFLERVTASAASPTHSSAKVDRLAGHGGEPRRGAPRRTSRRGDRGSASGCWRRPPRALAASSCWAGARRSDGGDL